MVVTRPSLAPFREDAQEDYLTVVISDYHVLIGIEGRNWKGGFESFTK
jgi:hypothetical protein